MVAALVTGLAVVAGQPTLGPTLDPHAAYLVLRGMKTYFLRRDAQCASAQRVAEFLAQHPQVTRVRYPGLPVDPAHAVARRQMLRFGPVVSFVLPGRARAEALLAACRLIYEATSFGGVHTSAERRARWGGDAIPEGFIRLSAGCEDADDLIADLAHALDTAATA